MNVISWNIRGLGSVGKSSWIRKLKVTNEVGFLMLLETQFQSIEGVDVSRFWGTGEFDFEYVDATGRHRFWAKEGDENSSFFHGVINGRRMSNSIPRLFINGDWVTKPNEIKKEVHRFFKEKFVEEIKDRPFLHVYGLKTLDSEAADVLVVPFLEKEIKMRCGFLDIFNNFAETGVISRGLGSSFITLVPKVNDPVDLGEYCPINLIGVVSKVISKVLVNRLKKVIDSLISETQSTFVAGIFILDGPLVISEVLSWARRCGKELFMFKIDFEKAYD
ncbi:uncharacterized protein LOC110914077 [Helianthus annuus]|uniref:uncharacterized protein LOC110914077 n=1 Tax=Helianthus annuus TaxID=4232 RepID=UPI000B8FF40B|nr:uncharacterized protein LOC110914077 [Helianthus annuus]